MAKIIPIFLLGLCGLCFSCTEKTAPPKPPNIVFIFSDDHALNAISAYGSNLNQTPNLDRIAQEGILFRNALVTNSICAPSRAVILTGKHSHINGILDNRLPFDSTQQTFPKLLQKAGYQTAMIGKWHLKTQPTGFDYWKVLPGQGHYYNPDFRTPTGRERIEGYVTDIITDLSLDWLANGRDQEKPFLLMSQHKAPHRVWAPGPDHLTTYSDVEIPEPPSLFDDYSNRASGARNQEMTIRDHMDLYRDLMVFQDSSLSLRPGLQRDGKRRRARMTEAQRTAWDAAFGPENEAFLQANLQGDDLTRWKYQRYLKNYLRTIASVDDNIGRIMDYLDKEGLTENTLFVYSSDQGFYLGEHGWYDKRWIYEESLHMPLLMRWPGVIEPGRETSELVQNLDFASTFLEAAGIKPPADMQGMSFLSLLQGKSLENWRKYAYFHYYEFPGAHSVPRHYGIRGARYKLAHYYQLDEWEFFDLEEDPDEMKNGIDDPKYADIVSKMKEELAAQRTKYADTQLVMPKNTK